MSLDDFQDGLGDRFCLVDFINFKTEYNGEKW